MFLIITQHGANLHLHHYVVQQNSIQQVREVQMPVPVPVPVRWHECLHLSETPVSGVDRSNVWKIRKMKGSLLLPTQVTSGLSMNSSRQGRKSPGSISAQVPGQSVRTESPS